jgi:phosphoglycolate phosphatase
MEPKQRPPEHGDRPEGFPKSSQFELGVFDYDGTLCDTRPAIVHSIQRTFVIHGRGLLEKEKIFDVVKDGLPLEPTLVLLDQALQCNPVLEGMAKTYRDVYRDEAECHVRPFRGVQETLHNLSKAIPCVVISNKGIDAIRRSLASHGLADVISLVIGDQPGIPKKPNPAILNDLVLRNFPRIDRRRVLMVGDTEIDIQFAQNAGVRSCWASYGYGDPARCEELRPDYRLDQVADIVAIVNPTAALDLARSVSSGK